MGQQRQLLLTNRLRREANIRVDGHFAVRIPAHSSEIVTVADDANVLSVLVGDEEVGIGLDSCSDGDELAVSAANGVLVPIMFVLALGVGLAAWSQGAGPVVTLLVFLTFGLIAVVARGWLRRIRLVELYSTHYRFWG
jgi:hypothetical protein